MASQKAISLPFSLSESYGISFTSNENKIYRDRVFLAVSTSLYERVMRPSYGTQVRQAIFENEAVASTLLDASIRLAFNTWLPDLSLISINPEYFEETGEFSMTINYLLPNEQTDEVSIKIGTFTRTGELVEGNI
jgi:phage baseplate assembly protein W